MATPSGITLAPEGGAHQSTQTPLVGENPSLAPSELNMCLMGRIGDALGMSQAGLVYFEPTYVDGSYCLNIACSNFLKSFYVHMYCRIASYHVMGLALHAASSWTGRQCLSASIHTPVGAAYPRDDGLSTRGYHQRGLYSRTSPLLCYADMHRICGCSSSGERETSIRSHYNQ